MASQPKAPVLGQKRERADVPLGRVPEPENPSRIPDLAWGEFALRRSGPWLVGIGLVALDRTAPDGRLIVVRPIKRLL